LRLLLDTHAALWFVAGDERLSATAHRHLTDGSNRILLSAAVVWEIAIKRSSGKLSVPGEYLELLLDNGVQPLPVSVVHATAVEDLPWHHHDPFDRMLVAQASVEGAAVVTRDKALAPYDVTLIW
jgi:PIN domain nuclease of toxin-antitoxin system